MVLLSFKASTYGSAPFVCMSFCMPTSETWLRICKKKPSFFSATGNKYILVYTEYLTKWVEAEGIPDKKAETVAESFVKFVCTHGIPESLITDQGREFCNELSDIICKKMGIDHRVASAYHPQTGGLTERMNRTLCTMLSTVVNENQNNWDEKIPYCLFAYRTSEQKSTKMDPFSLVYGRRARLPVELDLPSSPQEQTDEEEEEVSLKARVDAFIRLSESRKRANINIKRAQRQQKKYHDSNVKFTQFKVGDIVLLHNTRRTTRKGGKLESRWSGPFVVEKVFKKGVYKLKGRASKVNGNRLKLFRGENEDEENSSKQSEREKEQDNNTRNDDDTNGKKRRKVFEENSAKQSEREKEQDNNTRNDDDTNGKKRRKVFEENSAKQSKREKEQDNNTRNDDDTNDKKRRKVFEENSAKQSKREKEQDNNARNDDDTNDKKRRKVFEENSAKQSEREKERDNNTRNDDDTNDKKRKKVFEENSAKQSEREKERDNNTRNDDDTNDKKRRKVFEENSAKQEA